MLIVNFLPVPIVLGDRTLECKVKCKRSADSPSGMYSGKKRQVFFPYTALLSFQTRHILSLSPNIRIDFNKLFVLCTTEQN